MNEIVIVVYAYARALWRRRWLAIAAAWAICMVGWLVVATLPDRYEASARVYADSRTVLQKVVDGIAIDQDFDSELQMVREALLSRPQVEAVAHKTKLDATVTDAAGMDRLITNLQEGISVVGTSSGDRGVRRGANEKRDIVYTISYQHTDRAKSVDVVRTLLDSFVEGTLSGNRAGANEAQSFLTREIADLEKRLAESEERLAEFKKRNVGMLPEEGARGDYFSRLSTEQAGLQRARTDLAIAMSRREELQRQLNSARQYVPGTSNMSTGGAGAGSDLTARRLQSEAELQELLLRFTDKHPEVVALRESIAELKQREAEEMATLQRGGSGTGAIRSLSVNPVYQSIQTQLAQSEVDIAALRGAVGQHEKEIARLNTFVDSAPEVEQEYSRLNRDYDVVKAQYESLVKRLEQAKVSDAAAQSGIVRFEVIEPPHATLTPVWPKRGLLTVAVLLAGLALGAAIALVPQFLRPTFDNTRSLTELTGLPVLGSVSLLPKPGEPLMLRREVRLVSMAAGALVVLTGVLLVIGDAGARLIQSLLA
jgi:polysaccharide chain length determinant protein (PEP-CTERM system associated)